jgi:hypothetical protein
MEHEKSEVPLPMETDELRKWASGWAEKLLKINLNKSTEPEIQNKRN